MKTVKTTTELHEWFRSAKDGNVVQYHVDKRAGFDALANSRRGVPEVNSLAAAAFQLALEGKLFLYQCRKDGPNRYCAMKTQLSPDLTPNKEYAYV